MRDLKEKGQIKNDYEKEVKGSMVPVVGYSGTPLGKKLGVKDGQLTWRSKMPASVAAEIARYGATPKLVRTPVPGLDMAHLFVIEEQVLREELARLRGLIAQDGTVWVSWPKKTTRKDLPKVETNIVEHKVREAALSVGFVDVKICAIDEVWSGLKLVIRKVERARTKSP